MQLKILIIIAFLTMFTAVSSSDDQSNRLYFPEVLPAPDNTIKPVNVTEDNTAESSGGTELLNCTCTDIICSNCDLEYNLTNLIHNVTTIQFFEQVESADGEGKMYLEVHFCQLIHLRIIISNIGVSDQ